MRSILNQHPEIYIAKETHYFDDLRARFDPDEVRRPSDGVRARALSYFQEMSETAYALRQAGNVSPDPALARRLNRRALAIDSSLDAIFAAHCKLEGEVLTATSSPAAIWGEKTPRNIFRGRELLDTFSGAKLIFMLRDPRAAAASYRDWKNHWFDGEIVSKARAAALAAEERRVHRSYSLTLNVLMWRAATRTAMQLHRHYGPDRVLIVPFEHLVTDPDDEIDRVCRFIGIEPHPAMLDVSLTNSSYASVGSAKGFRPEPTFRWRSMLSSAEIRHVERIGGRTMVEAGYHAQEGRSHLLYALAEFGRLASTVPIALIANRRRIGSVRQYLAARLAGLRRN
jgi:Sulfotransferase family